jgi:tRNA(adenine34) deaminase
MNHDYYIKLALDEAVKAYNINEVPVGCVIVNQDKIIGIGHNLKETNNDVLAHAEMRAIKMATETIGNWRLNGCSMYVTLEPCPMCAAAIAQSRISKLYIGTFDPEAGACGSVLNIVSNEHLKYKVSVTWMYNDECSKIIGDFFRRIRKSK